MLQMIRRIVLLVLLAMGLTLAGGGSVDSLDWMFDNSFNERAFELSLPAITLPEEVAEAFEKYRGGDYRGAAVTIAKVRALALPDGLLDFTCFALAESYRMLKVDEAARENYVYLLQRFPESDKRAPSLFRLVQYAYKERAAATADSILAVFRKEFRGHPLYNSVHYEVAKLYYRLGRFSEATDVLGSVSKNSVRHAQSQLLMGLCYAQLKQWDKALLALDYARRNAATTDLAAEASIVIGDIYYAQGRAKTALQFYSYVPKGAKRAEYAGVKAAGCHLHLKAFTAARDLAVDYLRRRPTGEYAFEMMSVLEQAYTGLGSKAESEVVGKFLYRQVVNARLSFEVYQELNTLNDLKAHWRKIELEGMRAKNKSLVKSVNDNLVRLHSLEDRFWSLLSAIHPVDTSGGPTALTGLEVFRYLGDLRTRLVQQSDSIVIVEKKLAKLLSSAIRDSSFGADSLRLVAELAHVRRSHSEMEREYDLISREHGGSAGDRLNTDEETPAKYIDWAFLRYQGKKQLLSGASVPTDSLKDSLPAMSAAEKALLSQSLVNDRVTLKKHISSMLTYYPRSRFNGQILLRLAEMIYDEAADVFDQRLQDYEKRLAEGRDTAGLVFPDIDLGAVVSIYDTILLQYPTDPVADDALFYKALALQKQGEYESATYALVDLTKKYPESEFYVEANMHIGRYFFENPKAEGGTGYKRAEEAFREVLYFRDHPQYVQALYSLGWCYYMQDQYDEAIAVFKYLVEEVELDFDPNRMEEKQVVNPLLRGEAIDYIAISFDEENRIDDAVRFLDLIGNPDYAALVLKRIGELREEVQDYSVALTVYNRILKEYPLSTPAPEAAASIIKTYELSNKVDLALNARKEFLTTYGRNSDYWMRIASRDSSLLPRIDSMAVANGLYVADHAYRMAESSGETRHFAEAAERYAQLVKMYPDNPRSVEARWNLAILRDQKLGDFSSAYRDYIAYSRMPAADSAKREQAAMNAIALAQRMLPPDSLTQGATIDSATSALIDAVNNYVSLFSSGGHLTDALLTMGAVYFNRTMYANAAKVYQQIIDFGEKDRNYFKALFLLGQCHFGQERWAEASAAFERVVKRTTEIALRDPAQKLLIQSEYLKAKQLFTAGQYDKAAQSYLSIEERFPQSEYGDVVLFSAAEAYEKLEKWPEAARNFSRLVQMYPASKYAADALFFAASAYEKSQDYSRAADAYEMLVDKYTQSDKAKDALFNVGFCYEKLGKLDKMTEANVRYTTKYPEEKDAKAMFLRSGQFYFNAGMYEKAKNVYQNFLRRFAGDPISVEAYYMIGKIAVALGSKSEALQLFDQAERQHRSFVESNRQGNAYFASEAAFASAELKKTDHDAIRFSRSGKGLKDDQDTKTKLLLDAVRAYTRVVQYQSEKMFEAAFRIGELYEQYAQTFIEQKRDNLDPIKMAVFERDLYETAAALVQKAFVPYQKVIELGANFDSLSADQRKWIAQARAQLEQGYARAGEFLVSSVSAMINAPIPKEIKVQPVYYVQYLKQLNETIEPLKSRARDFFLASHKEMVALKLSETASAKCLERFALLNYQIGNDYEKVMEIIKNKDYEFPRNMSVEDREETEFQLEDILFELQDKAVLVYETALELAEKEKLQSNPWSRKILESLARLSPDIYGKSFYYGVAFATDRRWPIRSDSLPGWKVAQVSVQGWSPAEEMSDSLARRFPEGMPKTIWTAEPGVKKFYLRKDMYFAGQPRDASLYYAVGGKYRLFINGSLVVSDTTGRRPWDRIDSLVNMATLFRGGDNVLAIEAEEVDTLLPGITIVLSALIDTTQRFKSSIAVPSFASASDIKTSTSQQTRALETQPRSERIAPLVDSVRAERAPAQTPAGETNRRKDNEDSTAVYSKRLLDAQKGLSIEQNSIRGLRSREEQLETRMRSIREELDRLKGAAGQRK